MAKNTSKSLETRVEYCSDKCNPSKLKELFILYSIPIVATIAYGTYAFIRKEYELSFLTYSIAGTIFLDAYKNSTPYKMKTFCGIFKKWGNITYEKDLNRDV